MFHRGHTSLRFASRLTARFFHILLTGLAIIATAAPPVSAAEFPANPITYIIPFGDGGESSIAARLQQPVFKRLTGQDLIVVNKSDLDGAQRTADEIRQALQVGATSPPQIMLASAATGEGIEEMCISIDQMDERGGGGRAKLLERVKAVHEQALLDSPQLENILELVASGTSAGMALQALDKQSPQNTQKE